MSTDADPPEPDRLRVLRPWPKNADEQRAMRLAKAEAHLALLQRDVTRLEGQVKRLAGERRARTVQVVGAVLAAAGAFACLVLGAGR